MTKGKPRKNKIKKNVAYGGNEAFVALWETQNDVQAKIGWLLEFQFEATKKDRVFSPAE